MDINLARLRIFLPEGGDERLAAALYGGRQRFEAMLSHLCGRELSSDPELLRRHQKPGLPFVFSMPADGSSDLLLAGPSISCIPDFINAVTVLADLNSPPPFISLDYKDNPSPVCLPGKSGIEDGISVLSAAALMDMATPAYCGCKEISLEISTPMRLVNDGRELNRFDPVRLSRGVLRRVSSMAAYFGRAPDPELFRHLSSIAGSVVCVESRCLGNKASAGRGVSGIFKVAGRFDELGPYLQLGSLFNLGKGASFGMGQFHASPLY